MSDLTGLPSRPRFPRYFHLVSMGKEAIQLRSAHKTVVLSGKSVPALTKLLNLCDGNRSVDDLLREFPDIPGEDVLKAIRMLRERGVLEDAERARIPVPPETASQAGDPAPETVAAGETPSTTGSPVTTQPASGPEYRDQTTMFSIYYGDGEIPQGILGKSRMVIFGLGRVGSHAMLSLVRSGIGRLTVIDDALSDESLSITGAFYERGDANRPRSNVALERLGPLYPDCQLEALKCEYSSPRAAQAVDGAELVLVCQDGPAEDIYKNVNQIALKKGVRWLRASLEGFEAQLGPCFIPNDTACYTCLDLRSQANWTHFDENAAFKKHLSSGKVKADYGCLAPMSGFLGNMAGLECIRLLTGISDPITCGKLWTFNMNSFESQSHEVLKLPRCPSCGLTQKAPVRTLWEE